MTRPLVTFVLIFLLGAGAVAQDPQTVFRKGNALYEQKDYAGAIEAYSELIRAGYESAGLYYNLGNAYFRSGDLGHSILHYLRAQRLDPANDDIKANLAFARQYTTLQLEGVPLNPVYSALTGLVAPWPLDVWAWLASAAFVLLVVLLALRFGFGFDMEWLRSVTVVSGLILLTLAVLTTFKYRHEYLVPRAVIIAEDAPVRTGPSSVSEIELQGAPGLVVTILGESGDYVNIQLENQRRGWIERRLIADV